MDSEMRTMSLFGDDGVANATENHSCLMPAFVKVSEHLRRVNANDARLSGASAGNRGQIKKTRGRAGNRVPDAGVTLEPHVCRHCFARLVSQAEPTGGRRYSCTNCGATALGTVPAVLCSCGMSLRRHSPGTDPIDAGLRCQPNPAPTAAFPSLFVAVPVAKTVPFKRGN